MVPGGIYQRKPFFESQAAAGPYLGFIALWQFDEQAGGHQLPLQRRQSQWFFYVGTQVHAGTAAGFVAGQVMV